MPDNEQRSREIEDLMETGRATRERAQQQYGQYSKKSSKVSRNPFFSPSVMMLFICGIAVIVALIAFVSTFSRIAKANAEATPEPTAENQASPSPTPFPTPRPIPDVESLAALSGDLLTISTTEKEWCKKAEDPADDGLYFITKEDAPYLIYNVDSGNLCREGYSFGNFKYIWVNSDDDDFYAVLNISGKTVDLTGYYILVRDETGIYASRCIINCYEAKDVYVDDAIVTGTLLAPNATIHCNNARVDGQLIGADYDGNLAYKRDIIFTGYKSVMSVTHGIEFEHDEVKKRVIEQLKSQDRTGEYADYDMTTTVLEKDIKKLLVLDMSSIGLSDFGKDLDNFSHIISLDISKNTIKSFDLSSFPNLQSLNVSSTSITSLNLTPCLALVSLDMSNTRFSEMPDFSAAPKLEYLNLNNTAVSAIDYNRLQNLKYLSLSSNPRIANFDFGALPLLEQLDVRYCNLHEIDLSGAGNLWFLRCSGNTYETLDLDRAPELTTVEAYTDSLKTITARSFYSRTNVALYCLESTTVIR